MTIKNPSGHKLRIYVSWGMIDKHKASERIATEIYFMRTLMA